jgi:hypothetical protein
MGPRCAQKKPRPRDTEVWSTSLRVQQILSVFLHERLTLIHGLHTFTM